MDKQTKKTSNVKYKNIVIHSVITIAFLFAATGIGYLFQYIGFSETNIVVVYLLAVLGVSCLTKGYFYGLIAAVTETFAFNFFFTTPIYTFSVNDPGYIITFIIMTITSIITGTLTSKVKHNAEIALEKDAEAKALYKLTNKLTDIKDMEDIAKISAQVVSEIFNCDAACLFFGDKPVCIQQTKCEQKYLKLDYDIIKKKAGLLRSGVDLGNEYSDFVIYGREEILGILRLPKADSTAMNEMHINLLHSMIESIALAADNYISREAKIKSREETDKERYRSNLLRSISHDIRTPLSGIMGTSEMLMNMIEESDSKHQLATEINGDANWLYSLVENILSLTRLKDGNIAINKQLEALEEIIGAAMARIKKQHPESKISVIVPDEVLLVPVDGKLIEQVLINLMDNAFKYSDGEAEIKIEAITKDKNAVITVTDSGRGIKEKDLPNIFKTFYIGKEKVSDGRKGVGLGLAICDTVISAHGGVINAENRTDVQGAIFRFTLPLEVK